MTQQCLLTVLMALIAVTTPQNPQINPGCSKDAVDKINAYYTQPGHSYPQTLAKKDTTWTFVFYSISFPSPICVLQEVGDHVVKSTVKISVNNVKVTTFTTTYKKDVDHGLLKPTVQETKEVINLWVIKSTDTINTVYLCSDASNATFTPQWGVAIPLSKIRDQSVLREAIGMQKDLAKLGLNTTQMTVCKN